MKIIKKKISIKKIIILFVFVVSLCALLFSSYNIITWLIDNNKTKKVVKDIEEKVEIKETNEDVEIIESKEDKANPYWDYIKMKLIDVNFDELLKTNSDTKGWIKVEGTNINYPFVQTKDNNYYLFHSFNKTYNDAGWVFLDYRINSENFGKNTIIYAHGRYDNTMFGSLRTILESNWYSNINNHIVKLSTSKENTLWQVFSIYRIKTTSDYIQTDFYSDEHYQAFIDLIKNRSSVKFSTEINTTDKILTLSTCYNDYDKVVLHAKLIKRQAK